MITPEQEKWLSHLNNTNSTKVYPYDPSSERKFEVIKERVQKVLGSGFEVVHKGASSLGISGQGELDIYVPVEAGDFDKALSLVSREF